MSTRTLKSRRAPKQEVPLLYPGDHLSQPEFHRRYEAYPDDTRFELIGGIVYMMAPAGFEHGKSGYDITTVLGVYESATSGVLGATGPTAILGESSEPEPDVVLLVAPDHGGQTRLKQIDHKHYIEGGPELVVEVSHSTVSMDLHSKREDYGRGGVCEYIVICLDDRAIRWFDLQRNDELAIDDDQVLRSFAFPGLRIDTAALLDRNPDRLMKTLQRGIASPEHQAFVAKLAAQHKLHSPSQRKSRPGNRIGKRGKK
jgi:Uma2 family endonuclease